MTKRVAFYLRVSTGDGQQTIENQRRALDEIAERAGWEVVEVYSDEISGTKGRERRPAFDRMLKAAVHRKFDMIAAWSVDRLGRSLQDLVGFLGELKAAGVDLFLHQQALDTSTPSGRALFQMLGVFAEFETAMIRERTRAGLVRARAQGKRPRTAANHSHLIRRRVALIGRRHEHSQRSEASPCRHFDCAEDQINNVRIAIAILQQNPVRRYSRVVRAREGVPRVPLPTQGRGDALDWSGDGQSHRPQSSQRTADLGGARSAAASGAHLQAVARRARDIDPAPGSKVRATFIKIGELSSTATH